LTTQDKQKKSLLSKRHRKPVVLKENQNGNMFTLLAQEPKQEKKMDTNRSGFTQKENSNHQEELTFKQIMQMKKENVLSQKVIPQYNDIEKETPRTIMIRRGNNNIESYSSSEQNFNINPLAKPKKAFAAKDKLYAQSSDEYFGVIGHQPKSRSSMANKIFKGTLEIR